MLKSYFRIAWRNITKSRFYAAISIIGLSMGLAFVFLTGAYGWQELQVNQQLRHADRQYFLTSEWKNPNMGMPIITAGPLAKRLREDYPHLVANYYRWDGITSIISKGDKHFREGIQLGDSTLLSMYGFKLLYGNPATALTAPYSVVITKDKAMKYFGRTDVVGETLGIQSFSGTQRDFLVTGVLKDIPDNSVTHLNDNNDNRIFVPANTFAYFGRTDFDSWNNMVLPSYVELREGVSPRDLEKPIAQLIKQNASDNVKQNLTVRPVALKNYYLQKDNGLVTRVLYTLGLVAFFILLMAVVNFVNLAISRSATRMREIGIRKVLGGLRKQLIVQFLTESVILVFLSSLLALMIYSLARPVFQQVVGKEVPSLAVFPLYFAGIPLLLTLLTGLLAGFYPALVLSSIRSVDSLKGKLAKVKGHSVLHKYLAGFQFCIAGVVMIAAFIVTQQVSYFFGRGLGYNKEYVVSAQVPRDWTRAGEQKMETIRDEFARMPEIAHATLSYEIPDGMSGGAPPVYRSGTDSSTAIPVQGLVTDENYLSTYQIPLKAGSFFDGNGADSGKVILNEKAVAALGWANAQEAVGKQIRVPGDATLFTIKGVAGDFHFNSMQQKIVPAIFFNVHFSPFYRYLSFKIKPGPVNTTIERIQKKWASLLPGSSFEYSFMDDTLKKLYRSELQLKKAAYTATFLALIIALLGILGLVALSVQKRIKEVGIRKVLGASVGSVVSLFIKEFVIVIFIGGIIACPLAYMIMHKWLADYAYRIHITLFPFISVLLLLAVITILLIIMQTIRTAVTNPVRALRSE